MNYRVYQRDPIEKLEAMFDSTDVTGHGFDPDVVGYGYIHAASLRTVHRTMLVNVGSVGNPLDLPLACYAILEGSRDDAMAAPLAINVVRIPYDIERAIREAAAGGMPDLQPCATELRTAHYRGIKE